MTTSLLLEFEGTNGSTTFVDSSPSPKTITAFSGAQISTSQYKFGSSSGYFNGSSSYISTPTVSDLQFLTQDFTIEAWVYCQSFASAPNVFSQRDGSTGLTIRVQSTGILVFFGPGLNVASQVGSGISLNQWTHLAVVRNGAVVNTYINGIFSGTVTLGAGYSISYDSTTYIGVAISYGEYFNGYIDRLRVTNGTALYTADFDPDPWSLDLYTGETALIGNYELILDGTDFSFFARYISYSSSPRCITLDSYQQPDAGVNAVIPLKTKLQSTTTLQFRRSWAPQWYDDQTDAQLHLWLCPNWTPGDVQYYPANVGWYYSMIQWYCMPQSLIFRMRHSASGSIYVMWIKDGSTALSINLSVITPWSANEMSGIDFTKIVISTSGSGTQIDMYGGDGTLRQTGFDGTWTNIWDNTRTLTTDLLAIHYHNYLSPSNPESFCDIQFGTEILSEGFILTEYRNRQILDACLVSAPLPSTAMSYLLKSLQTLPFSIDSSRTEIYDPDTRYLDILDGGMTTVSGTVTMTGSFNRVFLVSKESSVVRETRSDPETGFYEFTNMKDQPYTIYSDAFSLNTLPVLYTGTGRIFGEVTIPGSHRVILLEYLSYKPIAWTLSDSVTGAYEFNGLNTTILFTLIAEHDSKRYVIRAKMRAE